MQCGIALYVSASDESKGRDSRDQFLFAGYIASEHDWAKIFTPAWQGLVLNPPPTVPYIHMTEMRSRGRREELKLSDQDANKCVDRAVSALGMCDWLFPIGLSVSGAHVRDAFGDVKVRLRNRLHRNLSLITFAF